jgi:hypothetical protein
LIAEFGAATRLKLIMVLAIALVLVAAAGTPPGASVVSVANRVLAAQPGNTLTMEMGSQTSFMSVERDHVAGRAIDLQRIGDNLRGFVGDEQSDLQLAPGRITGHIGAHAVSMQVERRGGALAIDGTFGRRAVALSLHPHSIDGDVGPCRFELRNQVGQYVGTAACGGRPTPVRLELPVALVTRDDAEVAAIVTALLAS